MSSLAEASWSMLAASLSSALRDLSTLSLFIAFDSILSNTAMGVRKMNVSGKLARWGSCSLRASRKEASTQPPAS
jgi:hypothetical protein